MGVGEFQEAMGCLLYRLGLLDAGRLVGGAQALVGSRKLGKFVYVPHGPLLCQGLGGQFVPILESLKRVAREEKADYLRVEPMWERGDAREELLCQAGFRPALVPSQAGGTTLLLDLRRSEDELLMGMRKTTRYLVKKAREMGVVVERTKDLEELEAFHQLMEETKRRQRFSPHSRRYHQLQFETLAPRGMGELYLAKYEGNVLAVAVIISYGDTASYLLGASLRSEVPASYLLQWEAIRQAKESGRDLYDFWGIAPTDDPCHPWHGYSLFKKGFGGYPLSYTGAWDFPITARYWAVAAKEWWWKHHRHL